jgi:hypothetical protein
MTIRTRQSSRPRSVPKRRDSEANAQLATASSPWSPRRGRQRHSGPLGNPGADGPSLLGQPDQRSLHLLPCDLDCLAALDGPPRPSTTFVVSSLRDGVGGPPEVRETTRGGENRQTRLEPETQTRRAESGEGPGRGPGRLALIRMRSVVQVHVGPPTEPWSRSPPPVVGRHRQHQEHDRNSFPLDGLGTCPHVAPWVRREPRR